MRALVFRCYSDLDMSMQATAIAYDPDTGILTLRLTSGEEFRITNAGHARTVKERLSVHGTVTDVQRSWLEQYRVSERQTNRTLLREKLAALRREMWRP